MLASLTALSTLAGCLDEAAPAAEAELGRLELPLSSTTSEGTLYRLSATFSVTSAAGVVQIDGTTPRPSVAAEVAPGLAEVRLDDGWSMSRSLDGGDSFAPVQALLGSANPMLLRVFAGTSSTLTFEFLIVEPEGVVNLRFAVSETTRQLGGYASFDEATGVFAPYLHRSVDLAIFSELRSYLTSSEAGKSRVYYAYTNALQLYGDEDGALGEVTDNLSGGTLQYEVTAKPDGSQEMSGTYLSYAGPRTDLVFEPAEVFGLRELDSDGYPTDTTFQAYLPFSLTLYQSEVSTAQGHLLLTHLVPE